MSYDENLVDNPFFKEVLKQADILNELIAQKRTLCVPCIGSYNKKHQFTLEDIETHAIVREDDSDKLFRTYNNKSLSMVTKGFKTLDHFDEERIVKILFEETFFMDESKHIQVICIDSRFDCSSSVGYTDYKCETLQQCTQFLFDENTPWARSQLDDVLQKCVVSHKSAGMCLKQLISNTRQTYIKCLEIVEKDFHFSRKVMTNPNFAMFLELSVEFYVMSYLHQTIFSELCYIFGAKDAALNKTLRNLSLVKPSEIEDLNPVFFTSLPISKSKMTLLNCEQSPREKIRLLCDCLMCLPNASETGRAMSMDDLLPLLNYLIIKSEVPNWLANICYMQHFTFAQYSTDDRHDFCLVCYEASLEHIRNGSLNYLVAPLNQSNLEALSLYDTTRTPLQISRNCVYLNRCDDLAVILGSISTPVKELPKPPPPTPAPQITDNPLADDTEITCPNPGELPEREEIPFKKCHPLCSCDICEKNILNVRWKDIQVNTAFDGSGVTILHTAAQNNYTQMIDLLVELGADANATDSAGRSPLHLACQRGAMTAVLLLIHHKATANVVDSTGRTPLHELCERGHTETLQALIYQKINLRVNAEAANGDTPLHLAARYGYGDIVSLLLDVGASMSIRNNKGETPLSAAQNKYISHILQLFSSELELEQIKKRSVSRNLNEEQEKLFRLCAEGDLQMIKHKLNIWDFRTSSLTRPRLQSIKRKCHPLCQCDECHEMVVQSQISRSLLCNSDQYTLLHIAALYGHADLALLFAGHFNWMLDAVTSRHKLSPLHLACQYNNEAIVDILITAGCDVNCRDAQGNTPLHFTCTNGHSGCAFLLLEGGCDIGSANERGDTALHQTARWGHIPLVNLLLRFKAPAGIKNKDGLLPLHLSQFDEVCEALRRAMGFVASEHSEDDTVYTDCNSHISTPSPNTERKSEDIAEKLKSLKLHPTSHIPEVPDITAALDELGTVPEMCSPEERVALATHTLATLATCDLVDQDHRIRTEHSTSQNSEVTVQSASQNSKVTDHSTSQNSEVTEQSDNQNSKVTNPCTSQNSKVTEHFASQNSKIAEQSTNQNSKVADHSTSQNSEVTEQSAIQNSKITEQSASQNSKIAEQSASQNSTVTEHSVSQSSTVTDPLDEDCEFGEDWVLENKPLSFCED